MPKIIKFNSRIFVIPIVIFSVLYNLSKFFELSTMTKYRAQMGLHCNQTVQLEVTTNGTFLICPGIDDYTSCIQIDRLLSCCKVNQSDAKAKALLRNWFTWKIDSIRLVGVRTKPIWFHGFINHIYSPLKRFWMNFSIIPSWWTNPINIKTNHTQFMKWLGKKRLLARLHTAQVLLQKATCRSLTALFQATVTHLVPFAPSQMNKQADNLRYILDLWH